MTKLKDLLSKVRPMPWEINHFRPNTNRLIRGDGTVVVEVYGLDHDEQSANARLIEHWSKTYEGLLEALKSAEWHKSIVCGALADWCPSCYSAKVNGHHESCKTQAAIKAADEVK